MASEISDKVQELIDDPKNFAHVATLMPDGSPQVTPVWISQTDGEVFINSAEGRLKVKNLRRDPRIAIEVQSAGNPYSYVTIRGRAEVTQDGADEHIDALAKKYMDVDSYPMRQPGEVRVKIKIEPEKVSTSNV